MIRLLLRLTMGKDPANDDPAVRSRYGSVAGRVGLCCNLTLAVLKLVLGLVTGAVSIAADAVNNFSDSCVSVVTLLGFRIAGKSADREHPYGHGRAEYVAGFIISAAVVAVALELLKTSVERIVSGSQPEVDILTTVLLAVAIAVKLWMGLFYSEIAKRINSPAMRASALDSLTDCIATGVALISVLLMLIFGINVDAWAGTVVAVLVMIAGGRSAYETIEPLLGHAPDPELVREIAAIAHEHKDILGTHDLRVHEYGPGHTIASMHVELPDKMELMRAHELVDGIEQEIIGKGLLSEITIHIDPVPMDDEELKKLKAEVRQFAREVDAGINVHDFRLVNERGRRRLLCEVMSPYELAAADDEIAAAIREKMKKLHPELELELLTERGEGTLEKYEDRKKGV